MTLSDATLLPLLKRANVFGALDMGLAPTLLPGRVSIGSESGVAALEEAWDLLPNFAGLATMEMLQAAAAGELKALIIVGTDPVRDSVNPALAAQALNEAEFVVAVDAFVTDSSGLADVILPGAVWGEVDGTVTNCEGRVQRLRPSLEPAGRARGLMGILDDLSHRMGVPLGASTLAMVSKEIADVAPTYAGITADYLTFEGSAEGVVVPDGDAVQPLSYIPQDVSVPVVTGEFTLHLEDALYDDGVWVRNAESIRDLARSTSARMHPGDASRRAFKDGDVITIAGTLEIRVRLDDQVSRGTIVVPFNQPETAGLVPSGTISVDVPRGGS
jgi:predicted molibdopterin-dependent oxidoreductase YjgC